MKISFNVVKKQEQDVKVGEVLYGVDEKGAYTLLNVCSTDVHSYNPFEVGFTEIDWVDRPTLTTEGIINPDRTVNVLELIKASHVAENATTEPEPEQEIISIRGVKHVITRKPCGGWSEPVLWEPAVGDEVELGQLKVGDRVLIEGEIKHIDGVGDFKINYTHLPYSYRWFSADDKVIYNGRSES